MICYFRVWFNEMVNRIIKILIIVILSIGIESRFALAQQYDEKIKILFDSSLALYNTGKYEEALSGFKNLSSDYNYNSRTTAAELFKLKIHLELNQMNQFKFSADQFLKNYPESSYTDEVKILLVKYYLEIANYYNAFKETLDLINNTASSFYEQKVRKIGEGIAAKYLTDIQLDRLNASYSSNKIKSFILLQKGKYYLRNGNSYSSKNTFEEIINNYPESEEYSESKKLVDNSTQNFQSATTVIGIMLPLDINQNGEYGSLPASEILEGIKFAVDEFNRNRNDKVGLLIRDTKKDNQQIIKIKDEFTELNSLVAVIGPIFSNEVRAALDAFDDYDIPIISPTATDDDLTSISHNFFQANPSFSVRGRVVAQYIYYVENKRKISVLNSIDSYSPILAKSFIEEFENLGGQIIRKESFKNDFTDFRNPISKIFSDSLIIEGVYIPLSDNTITPLILSEMVKYQVKIPVYGNQDWFTAKGFETAPEITNNLIFESDYFVDFNTEAYQNFNEKFISVAGKDVNRNVLYGYDAAKFLLTAYRNSGPGRKNLVEKMSSGMVSNGLRNNISFDERRINRFLNIIRFRDGVFELIDKFKLN